MTIGIAVAGEGKPPERDGVTVCPACGRRAYNSDADAWCGYCGQRIKRED